MLDPPTHNRPFADKRDKVGMDGVPKQHRNMNIGMWGFCVEKKGLIQDDTISSYFAPYSMASIS